MTQPLAAHATPTVASRPVASLTFAMVSVVARVTKRERVREAGRWRDWGRWRDGGSLATPPVRAVK